MKKPLENVFSWSVSRDRVFRECPRKYFYTYYGHWGGWETNAPERTRQIYVLKQLKNRATWIGEVVHDCIARTLKNLSRGIPILPLEEILTITRDRMRQDFRSSRSKMYWQNPRTQNGFFEHEYAVEITDSEWKESAEQVYHCLNTFYSSTFFRELQEMDRSDYLEVEEFSSFILDGFEVKIKLDCACREKDKVMIWDWKTGKTENAGDMLQMACYTAYAMHAYNVELSKVVTHLFNLYTNKLRVQQITGQSLDELRTYIRGSIKDMQGLLEDPERNTASEDSFAKVEKYGICSKCNFLRICQPDI